MTCDAVVLTRLEWDRLVSCGWLRLHDARLIRVDDWFRQALNCILIS